MNFSKESLEGKLLALPCHFSWSELQQGNVGSTLEMNIENLEEHIQENLQGTEIESYNLMGFYKTEQKCFEEARQSFNKALEYNTTEDQSVVSLSCLAWLTWKEETTGRSSEGESVERTNQVQQIIRGRPVEEIPEIMAEKAFAIANSGFSEKGFAKAIVSIDKALERKPDNVMYKFNKVVLMQQLYLKKHKSLTESDDEPKAINKLWEEIIDTLEQMRPRQTVLYGHVLVKFAIFLNQTNRDYGASGRKYVEKAKEIAGSNHTIMRNVANFYFRCAGNNVSQLNKAEDILERITKSKPTDDYKEQTLLGKILLKKYIKLKSCEMETFVKAEKCLRKSWEINKPYMMPALDLVRLYQRKYDKTHDESTLLEAEKVFREIFRSYFDSAESLKKSNVCKAYARFLKEYGMNLAHFYCQATRSTEHEESVSGKTKSTIEEAQRFLHQYTENRENENLLNAEQIFTGIYNSLEDLRDSAKDLFHKEYSAFLKNYSRDLAFCYFEKSLRYNPQQSHHEDSYKELKQLAEEKIASSVKEEQIKGHRTLKWMEDLQAGRIN